MRARRELLKTIGICITTKFHDGFVSGKQSKQISMR